MCRLSVILLLCTVTSLASANTFECGKEPVSLTGSTGFLSIARTNTTCKFKPDDKSSFFAIKTDDLSLYSEEYIEVSRDKSLYNISGQIDSGYIIIAEKNVEITFHLDLSNSNNMLLEFHQNKESVPIDVDKKSELVFRQYGKASFNLDVSRTTEAQVHIEVLGSNDIFGHYLLSASKNVTPIMVESNSQLLRVKTSLVRSDCSSNNVDNSEAQHDINGPEASTISGDYKCVNLFSNSMSGQAHYDVDFKNFLDIVDDDDELRIDDGIKPMVLNRRSADRYDQHKPVISFKGQKLAVIYDSPLQVNPRGVFKLTVIAKAFGGVVDSDQVLALPTKGLVQYSLRPQEISQASVLEFSGKLSGANIMITNSQKEVISLTDSQFLPPMIALNQEGEETKVDFDVRSKVSAEISYKQRKECGGTIFGTSGSISIDGGNKTCYWLLGQKSTLKINYINLIPNGCLEIHPLNREKALFSRCDISSVEVLPQFILGPAYLKITLPTNESRFDSSVSGPLVTQVNSATSNETKVRSVGYPSSYPWTTDSDNYAVNAVGKSILLSIADLDIRAGEKLLVNNVQVDKSMGDIDLSNKASNLTLQRTANAKDDFGAHKGYSLVLTQFQSIIAAPPDKTEIQTPANLTSLLLKISAPQNKRLNYSIPTSSTAKQDYTMKVFDANSILGLESNEAQGSSTSNTLFVSLVATTSTTLPQLKITYTAVDCNKTSDHVCDNSMRCVPAEKLCKGRSYCQDGSDLKVACTNGPTPPPQIIEKGSSGLTVFFLSLLMFSLGIVATLYGPGLYKQLESRFRSGQYTTFTSTE